MTSNPSDHRLESKWLGFGRKNEINDGRRSLTL